jgi:AcrR family transcriptional regulator
MGGNTKKKSRHRPRPDLKLRVLEVARELFAYRPFDDVKVDEVAAGAGVAKGVVYYYFDSKRGLFEAVFREAAAILVDRLRTIKNQDPYRPQIVALSEGLDEIFAWADEYEDLIALAGGGIGVDRGILAITNAMWEDIMNLLLDGVDEDAMRQGLPAPPRSLARQYAVRGWVHLVKSFAETSHDRRDVSIELLRDIALRLFIEALANADAAEAEASAS